jgi:hypothetical protein
LEKSLRQLFNSPRCTDAKNTVAVNQVVSIFGHPAFPVVVECYPPKWLSAGNIIEDLDTPRKSFKSVPVHMGVKGCTNHTFTQSRTESLDSVAVPAHSDPRRRQDDFYFRVWLECLFQQRHMREQLVSWRPDVCAAARVPPYIFVMEYAVVV